jgi:hypothetical protein
MGSKVNMSDMKRRATALLDFISRTQLELAGEALPTEGSSDESTRAASKTNGSMTLPTTTDDHDNMSPSAQLNGDAAGASGHHMGLNGGTPSKEFKEQNCMEMMDSLTRRLVKWQQEYTT